MTVFAHAANVLASDPNLFGAGTFTAPGGPPIPVRVFVGNNDPTFFAAGASFQSPGVRLRIPVSMLPGRPVEHSTVVVGPTTYTVTGARADSAGMLWLIDVD